MQRTPVILISVFLIGITSACNQIVAASIAEARRGQLHRDLANGDINSSEFSDAMRAIDLRERHIRQQNDKHAS